MYIPHFIFTPVSKNGKYIDDKEIPVVWENNPSVDEIRKDAENAKAICQEESDNLNLQIQETNERNQELETMRNIQLLDMFINSLYWSTSNIISLFYGKIPA